MRLSKVKLAGFKSFVDPTTIPFISNLTAVAGPNGCGKSNVIDAVRWVMGESSAKHLRGGAATDVIFNGSSARKPVGQATVELIFDNSDGRLGGEYAAYAEIAIKRQVTRDGQSHYFLNGQRCRRKDITDIFLGTGLGPRSYAIIEQGMITRIIEAKPEELRLFIEEAAGVSRYKERRKETENRIQHTQDNLARVNDLREELANQLRHLERQAQTAERYQTLKAQEQELSGQLAALAWKRLDQEIQVEETQIRETNLQLEVQQTDCQQFKTQQEKQRLVQGEMNQLLNDTQMRYYSVGTEIAKIEQMIQHQAERAVQLKNDKQEAQTSLNATQLQLESSQQEFGDLQQKVVQLTPEHQQAVSQVEQALIQQNQAEAALEQWREQQAQLQQALLTPTRQAEAEKAKITQLERQIQQTFERQKRLLAEFEAPVPDESGEFSGLEEVINRCQQQLTETKEKQQVILKEKEQLVHEVDALKPEIKELTQTLNQLQGEKSALITLQQAALGENTQNRTQWLAEQEIEACYLPRKIEVTPGWEAAVEWVLDRYLQALVVEKDITRLAQTEHLPPGITLLAWQSQPQPAKEGYLISQVKGGEFLPSDLYRLLSSVRLANDMQEALEILSCLKDETVITPLGHWLGEGWLKVKPEQNEVNGVLQREEKLKTLVESLQRLQTKVEEKQAQLKETEQKLATNQLEKEAHFQRISQLQQQIMKAQNELQIKQTRWQQIQVRQERLKQDLSECQVSSQEMQQEVNTARGHLNECLEQMAQFNQAQQQLLAHKADLQNTYQQSREGVNHAKEKAQQLVMDLQRYQTQLESLGKNSEHFTDQIAHNTQRLKNIEQLLVENEQPIAQIKSELEANLEKRLLLDNELNVTRDQVAQADNVLRELDQKIQQNEQMINTLRGQLEQFKLNWQALSVRRENILEKLEKVSLQELLATMPVAANEEEWQIHLNQVEQKIQKLGAINLAAIEEYQAACQRKEYLDSQLSDLNQALETLETAIKKIDRETRLRFKETFDKINHIFTQLFPRLFGGGQASLILTGEELLDTGISLVARPPGKKNSTIHQLSGGEKALTAVALVFSIFELNPAPFCMLDEVDAPLDDSNVGRFCNLVKEMSKTVQFIYVSHNKAAIEMAEQLQGVTMREPGVSRLVTVDIEEAKAMAQA